MPSKSRPTAQSSTRKAALRKAAVRKAAAPKVAPRRAVKTGYINARVQPKLKKDAEKVFAKIGVSTSEAVTVFLKQVVLQKGLPFPIRIPNAETLEAMRELESGGGMRYNSVDDMWADLLKPD